MKTIAFIGSDKNAGKTTVLNFIYDRICNGGVEQVCLASIGINGESVDAYDSQIKPKIVIRKNSWFITTPERMRGLEGKYSVISVLQPPLFRKIYVLAKANFDFPVVLEGPNEKDEILQCKLLLQRLKFEDILLLDGSIDRQFLAEPRISDEIFFALLISARREQKNKAEAFLKGLSLPLCEADVRKQILPYEQGINKSILFNYETKEIVFQSEKPPVLDEELKGQCLKWQKYSMLLYLNGAFTKSLFQFFAPFKKMQIVLNNFSLYQSIHFDEIKNGNFNPLLSLYHPVNVRRIFLKQETEWAGYNLPKGITIHNLYQEEVHEIRI